MTEIIVTESIDTTEAIDSKIMNILNPSLHHHDLLQSYVRAPADATTSSRQSEESDAPNKNPSFLGTCLAVDSSEDVDKESCISNDRRKKRNDKKQQKYKTDKSSIESEMNMQKKKK
ncbi:uncharacterized protein LOC117228518 [Megalopta genalis]|uniref:uncharacterized protein LOC117228518 n=1 Tax=Megalopta genalis TaxID=115081 RepID=UPI00144382BB|nr:uncharacterized protein LOC117228518 [Megalopta genalis]